MTGYQRAIFDIEKTYPGTAVCNLGGIIRFAEGTEESVLIDAVGAFIRETPSIRIQLDRSGMMYVSEREEEISITDFDGDCDAEAKRIAEEPFELYDSPLYSFRLLRTSEGLTGIMKLHHILGDHTAVMAFFRRLEKLAAGAEQRIRKIYTGSPVPSGAAEHYKRRLTDGIPAPLFAYPKNLKAGVVKRDLKQSQAIAEFCREKSVKPLSVLTAAIAIYMKKTRGADRTVIGNTVLNRDRHSLFNFGMYANTLPLFIDCGGSFEAALASAEAEIAAGAEFCAYPLTDMLADNGIGERCFDIAVNYISSGMVIGSELGDAEKLFNGCCELPVRMHLIHTIDGYRIEAEYIKELFSDEYINGFISSLEHIIDCGIKGTPLSAASPEDIIAYSELNNTPVIAADTTVSRIFAEYAAAHAEDTAYIYDGEAVSYRTALGMAETVARQISGCRVAAIVCGRCRYLIPAMLGALMSGAAYMPFDAGGSLPDCCDRVLSLSEYRIDGAVCLDKLDYNDTGYQDNSTPDGIAYYMNTSGSSGEPKTVMIKNSSLYIRLRWMHDKYGLDKRVLQKTALTFDVSGWELLSCAFGGTVVLMRDGEERSPTKTAEYINEYKIELIHFVPSMLRLFFAETPRGGESLTDIISSGEALAAADVQFVRSCFPEARLHNLYGPTECTIDVAYHDCAAGTMEIPIGRPLYNTKLYIVNSENELMPRGENGELVVCGDLVGAGYLYGGSGYTELYGAHAYKTGDICRLGFDGEIYYIGRSDREVKINGMRVSLDGLEALAMKLSGVSAAAAAEDGGRAYLFLQTDRNEEDIRAALGELTDRLPSYILCVDEIPVTPAGKLDRTALVGITRKRRADRQPPRTAAERDIYNAVLSELNAGGAVYEGLDINEDIFNAGISSLSVLVLEKKLSDMGYGITAGDIYLKRSIRALAADGTNSGFAVCLKHGGGKRVLCCFPYAGSAPQVFLKLAEGFDGDVIGIDYSCFGADDDVVAVAAKTARELSGYDSIYIASFCIGSVFAIETAYQLEAENKPVSAVYIMGSLPPMRSFIGNPWRKLPRGAVISMVSRLGGRSLPRNFPIDRFIRDTDRYFRYSEKRRIHARAYIAYASGDGFTNGYKRMDGKWRRFFAEDPVVTVFESASHYYFEETEDILRQMEAGENA